jgi:hypothetical protein
VWPGSAEEEVNLSSRSLCVVDLFVAAAAVAVVYSRCRYRCCLLSAVLWGGATWSAFGGGVLFAVWVGWGWGGGLGREPPLGFRRLEFCVLSVLLLLCGLKCPAPLPSALEATLRLRFRRCRGPVGCCCCRFRLVRRRRERSRSRSVRCCRGWLLAGALVRAAKRALVAARGRVLDRGGAFPWGLSGWVA